MSLKECRWSMSESEDKVSPGREKWCPGRENEEVVERWCVVVEGKMGVGSSRNRTPSFITAWQTRCLLLRRRPSDTRSVSRPWPKNFSIFLRRNPVRGATAPAGCWVRSPDEARSEREGWNLPRSRVMPCRVFCGRTQLQI